MSPSRLAGRGIRETPPPAAPAGRSRTGSVHGGEPWERRCWRQAHRSRQPGDRGTALLRPPARVDHYRSNMLAQPEASPMDHRRDSVNSPSGLTRRVTVGPILSVRLAHYLAATAMGRSISPGGPGPPGSTGSGVRQGYPHLPLGPDPAVSRHSSQTWGQPPAAALWRPHRRGAGAGVPSPPREPPKTALHGGAGPPEGVNPVHRFHIWRS